MPLTESKTLAGKFVNLKLMENFLNREFGDDYKVKVSNQMASI